MGPEAQVGPFPEEADPSLQKWENPESQPHACLGTHLLERLVSCFEV